MTTVILETWPLVALINRRDRFHAWAREALDTVEPPVVTCDAVLSEACFLLRRIDGGADVLGLVAHGIVKSAFASQGKSSRFAL